MDAETSTKTVQENRPQESPLARANRVAAVVNLERVRFVHFVANALAGFEKLSSAGETDYTVGFTRPRIRKGDAAFSVSSTLVFSLDSKAITEGDAKKSAEPLASLRATIELHYIQKADTPELSDDDVTEFANVNVPFNSWGYWREFVQSGLGRLGVAQTVTLPLFRVHTAKNWMIDDDQLALPFDARGRGESSVDAADSKPAVQ